MFEAKKYHFSFYGPQMSRLLIKTHFGIHYISEKMNLHMKTDGLDHNQITRLVLSLGCIARRIQNRTELFIRTEQI